MCGSGNLLAFEKLLKIRQRSSDDMNYGSHMSWIMSVGLLFLGSGTCTIGNSNKAVAALFCSFFPLYPSCVSDNRHHLQALRHLWVLAVENRCLATRDVHSDAIQCIPIEIMLKSAYGTSPIPPIRTFTPIILPHFGVIERIRVLGPRYINFYFRYWSMDIDIDEKKLYKKCRLTSWKVWVQRKTKHLSYINVRTAKIRIPMGSLVFWPLQFQMECTLMDQTLIS
jgi:anaphase-promoting complex subunit 1